MSRKSSVGGSARQSLPSARQSLSSEPLRVRNMNDGNSRRSSANSLGRPSLSGQGARKKSFLPKSTIAGPGAAAAASKRQSSGFGRGFGRSDVQKDPRPISDKGYQHRSVKRLVEFLLANGYRHPVSTKLLHSPQSKDFFHIFEFLYKHFDSAYKIGKKPEEEIPMLLKMLRYPANISKSAMFTIGTPHTWPHLLAALTWMIDTIQLMTNVTDVDEHMFRRDEDQFDGMPLIRIRFNYISITYEEFMIGEDTFEVQDEELNSLLKKNIPGSANDRETVMAEYNRLSEELRLLEQEPDKVRSLEHEREVLLSDNQMFMKFLSELQAHMTDQEQIRKTTDEEKVTLTAELKASEESNDSMKKIMETQEFTSADVDRIKHEGAELQRQINSVEREIEGYDNDIWSLEVDFSKRQEQTEVKCREYNRLAQQLKLIPSNAENARARDVEMRPVYTTDNAALQNVKSLLQEIKLEFKEKSNKKAEMRLNAYATLEEVSEVSNQKMEDLAMLDSKLKRVDEALNCKKEMYGKEWAALLKDIEDTRAELSMLMNEQNTDLEEAVKNLDIDTKQEDPRLAESTRLEAEYCRFLKDYTRAVLEHKQAIADGAEKAHTEMGALLEKLLANQYKPPSDDDEDGGGDCH